MDQTIASQKEEIPSNSRRQAREQRILDAAGSLILRQGYRKTSMASVARAAGVGKGTLYLHWATREDLFFALIAREKIAMAVDLRRRIENDPVGATLHGLLKYAALALIERPLLKAMLLGDTQVFGELVAREQGNSITIETLAGFSAYLQELREQGMVRDDLSLAELGAVFSSIFLGFFLATPFLPETFKLSGEHLAELLAETGKRALEPREPLPHSAVQSAAHNLKQFLDHSVARAGRELPDEQPVQPTRATTQARRVSRVRGRNGGRPKKLKTAASIAEVRRMYADPRKSIQEICDEIGISRASLYRYLKQAKEEGFE